jgi:hypothetical protein
MMMTENNKETGMPSPDDHATSKAHCRHDYDHHERQCRHNVALEFGDLHLGEFRCDQ